MNKPRGFEEARAFGEFETLPAGGYKCVIKKSECGTSQNGKEFLKLMIDIAEGGYKDFYQKKFLNDTRSAKKWSGVWAVFIEGYEEGTTNAKFKGLITSVEESNLNFKFNFDEKTLEGKKVGIVFREEEFLGQDNEIHTSVKPFYAVSYDKAEEAKVPKLKKLEENASEDSLGFMQVEEDSNLPF